MQQQFNLNSIWGSALYVLLVLIIASFEFEKSNKLLVFYAGLNYFIILVFIDTLFNYRFDFEKIEVMSQELNQLFPSIILPSLNYFSMCFITGFSMAVVISGDALRLQFTFACAHRLSSKQPDKFYTYYVAVTLAGFALSF
ncbi:hypothetical protein [Facklamia sp. P13055]|uniref:hypothetical protein n=1 Tax=Facklamia sp. P13055 TaxID=3421952 RepID=UPI003D186887